MIKFELAFAQFGFYLIQNDLPSERKSFLTVPGLESFDFDEFLTNIWSKSKFEKIKKSKQLYKLLDIPLKCPYYNKKPSVQKTSVSWRCPSPGKPLVLLWWHKLSWLWTSQERHWCAQRRSGNEPLPPLTWYPPGVQRGFYYIRFLLYTVFIISGGITNKTR